MKKSLSVFIFLIFTLVHSSGQLALEFDINQDAAGALINEGHFIDQWLVFSADDGLHGREPWVINLETGEGLLIDDMNPFTSSSSPLNFISINDKVYFTANDNRDRKLWSYIPATDELEKVVDNDFILNSGNVGTIYAFNGKIVMGYEPSRNAGAELYMYDPDLNTLQQIGDINPDGGSSPSNFISYNGSLLFSATSSATGSEIWQYNPGTGDVEVLTDDDNGSAGKSPRFLSIFGDKLYFTGFKQDQGTELYAYDFNTESVIFFDLFIGRGSSDPFDFTPYNGQLYFRARPNSGRQMLSIDSGGNITEIGILDVQEIEVFQDDLLVLAATSSSKNDFYRFNDQAGNYELLQDAFPGGEGVNAYGLLSTPDRLYFPADPPEYDTEWFYYDGMNPAQLLYEVNKTTIGSSPFDFTPFQGKLYFSAENNIVNRETWVYDPASGTTTLLEDLQPGLGDSQPFSYVTYDDRLFFGAKFGDVDHELVAYNPVTEKIELIADINPGSDGSYLEYPTVYDDVLYFSADGGTNGDELYQYNVTTNQLSLVADIAAGDEDSFPRDLTVYNGKLYFTADDRVNGNELWVLDGIGETPRMVKDIDGTSDSSAPEELLVYKDQLYFTARDMTGKRLFMSYSSLTDEITVYESPSSFGLEFPTIHNEKIYAQFRDRDAGQELGVFNESSGEWELAADIREGSGSSNPRYLVSYNGYLYFSAEEDTYGRELYEYNDTTGTHRLYADIWQGGFSSEPRQMTNFNGKMYFAANNGDKGEEIWSLAPCINAFVTTTPDFDQLGNGTATISIVGGTPPYTLEWDNGITSTEANGLESGTYSVEITDGLGCKTTLDIVITAVDTDLDDDGVIDEEDNCPSVINVGQEDNDEDGAGDACDEDDDNDAVLDIDDNCPFTINPEQDDNDQDGLGDTCDDDDDNDFVLDSEDNCMFTSNAGQDDNDEDGMGDACDDDDDNDDILDVNDNCPFTFNRNQQDFDNDGIGDICDDDDDNDSVLDEVDNCKTIMNPDQADNDMDGIGDLCDEDDDNDGILDDVDNCPFRYNPGQEDTNGNGVGDACATTSVNEQFSSQINLYPNPASGWFNLEMPSNISDGQIKIFNALGNCIRSIDYKSNSEWMEIRDLSPGTYNVMIIADEGSKIGVKRVIVIH